MYATPKVLKRSASVAAALLGALVAVLDDAGLSWARAVRERNGSAATAQIASTMAITIQAARGFTLGIENVFLYS